MTRITAIVAILTAFAGLCRAEEKGRTISTTGDAKVFVVPDEVVVTFGVQTFNASLEKCKAENEKQSAALVAAIKTLVADEKQIQTEHLRLEIAYKRDQPYSAGIDGYFARRSYAVTLKDAKKLEDLVSKALESGANQIVGIDYRSSEMRKHKDEARKLAIRAAKEKAIALAGELECKVGSPRTITEQSSDYAPRGANSNLYYDAGGASDDAATMMLGQIEIRGQVSVTFDLETK